MPQEPFIGQIITVPYNFAPRNYAFCQGQLIPVAQNTALFSLLGTTYGGDGWTTFALPNLNGRVATGMGQGPGLSPVDLGEERPCVELGVGGASVGQVATERGDDRPGPFRQRRRERGDHPR